MKILDSKTTLMDFPEKRKAIVYVDESKTNYYVTFRPVTKERPQGWAGTIGPIKVKKAKRPMKMTDVILAAYDEYMKDDIWLWR